MWKNRAYQLFPRMKLAQLIVRCPAATKNCPGATFATRMRFSVASAAVETSFALNAIRSATMMMRNIELTLRRNIQRRQRLKKIISNAIVKFTWL